MSAAGSGLFFALGDQLMFGSRQSAEMVHCIEGANGEKKFVVRSRLRNWGSLFGTRSDRGKLVEDGKLLRYRVFEDSIRELRGADDRGLTIGDQRYLLLNGSGQIILTKGRVMDRKTGEISHGDTRPVEYAVKRAPLKYRLAQFARTPDRWVGAVVILAISGVFDTGVFLLGERYGNAKADKLAHTPSRSRLLATAALPIPLTTAPIKAPVVPITPERARRIIAEDETSAMRRRLLAQMQTQTAPQNATPLTGQQSTIT